MEIAVWKEGRLTESTLEEVKDSFKTSTWISITDPTIDDLRKIAETIGVDTHILIGKLRSSYPHVDSYPEYTKIFSWHVARTRGKSGLSFRKSPVIVLTNKSCVLTISHHKIHLSDRVESDFDKQEYASFTIPARITYIVLGHLIEDYEISAEKFESLVEKMEEMIPPWTRSFYTDSFTIRKEAGRLLRMLNHFRAIMESLSRGRDYLDLSDHERRALDILYDRAVGSVETVETSLQSVRDLIELHLDTVSHDMNRAMRLMAAITCIVAIPSVIGAILGMNLIDVPWPWDLWHVLLLAASVALIPTAYFYKKGWLRDV